MEGVVIDVLRARELQRLRRIRQLGLAHYVFPGAEHSRLAHSLGAAYLAVRAGRRLLEATDGQLISAYRPSEASVRDLAIAALCHDLGHGPFSHAWEREVVGEGFDRKAWTNSLGLAAEEQDLRSLKWHELVGQALLAWEDGQLHRLLEQHEQGSSTRIRFMLRGEYFLEYMPRLLSSDIDVDRCDFLMRDAHQCGVHYGRYDLNWLISTLGVGEANGRLVVGFDVRKSPRVIEQVLIARRALYDSVYHHKTVRSAEGMVGLFLRRLKSLVASDEFDTLKGVLPLVSPFIRILRGQALEPDQILSLDDYALWVLADTVRTNSQDPTACDLARRLLERDLFKVVPVERSKLEEFLMQKDAHERIAAAVNPFCPGIADFYYFVDHSSFRMLSEDEGDYGYFVDCDGGTTGPATPIREHPSIRAYWGEKRRSVRIFTVREAVQAVRSAIES